VNGGLSNFFFPTKHTSKELLSKIESQDEKNKKNHIRGKKTENILNVLHGLN